MRAPDDFAERASAGIASPDSSNRDLREGPFTDLCIGAKKLILPDRPAQQTFLFRMQWQSFSVSTAREFPQSENAFSLNVACNFTPVSRPIGTNFTLRGINTAVLRANQPEMNTCTKKVGGRGM
jgi:hypothetical protein